MRVVTNIIGQSQYFRQVSVWKSEARYIWPVTSASGCMFRCLPSRSLAIILSMLSLSVSPTLPPCPNTLFSMLLLCWSVTSLALVLGDAAAGEMSSVYFILLKWVKSSDLDSINQSCNQMGDRVSVHSPYQTEITHAQNHKLSHLYRWSHNAMRPH